MKYQLYKSGGKNEGPLTIEDLKQKIASREIDESSFVAEYIGIGITKSFHPLTDIPELLPALQEAINEAEQARIQMETNAFNEYVETCSTAISLLDQYLDDRQDWVDITPADRIFLEGQFEEILSRDLDQWDEYSRAIYKKFLKLPGRERYLNLMAIRQTSTGTPGAGSFSRFPTWPAAAALLMSTQLRDINSNVEGIQEDLSDLDSGFDS